MTIPSPHGGVLLVGNGSDFRDICSQVVSVVRISSSFHATSIAIMQSSSSSAGRSFPGACRRDSVSAA